MRADQIIEEFDVRVDDYPEEEVITLGDVVHGTDVNQPLLSLGSCPDR